MFTSVLKGRKSLCLTFLPLHARVFVTGFNVFQVRHHNNNKVEKKTAGRDLRT
jgi:hypothetical protein